MIVLGILLIAAERRRPVLPLAPVLSRRGRRVNHALPFAPLIVNQRLEAILVVRGLVVASFLAVSTGWVWTGATALSRL